MLKENQLRILEYVYDAGETPVSGIARALKINYRIVHHFVNQLEKQGYLASSSVRPVRLVRLHKGISVSQLTEIEAYKRCAFLGRHPKVRSYLAQVVEEAEDPFLIVLVFGSYARGAQSRGSDLDIAAIVTGERRKSDVGRAIRSGAGHDYLNVHEHVFTADEFREMLESKEENVGTQMMTGHVLISNAESFVRMGRLWQIHRR
ncbi:nucleotidyltransferase domain-containing protein [archaeon]|nr:nucleotidyltransferase domain-containing protein [archaeon]